MSKPLSRAGSGEGIAALRGPSTAMVLGVAGGVLALVALVVLGWFDAQPLRDGAVWMVLFVLALGAYVAGIVRRTPALAAGGLLLAMLAVWHHAFGEMWMRWFPGWTTHTGAPITTRLSAGDSYYSHGPLVPICSIVIAYLIYRRVGVPTGRTRKSAIWGGLMVGMSLLLQLMAARGDVTFVAGFAMIGLLAGLTVMWGGWPLARAYWLPIVFLFFMVPLPMDWIAKINYELKTTASNAAVWATNRVFGVVAVVEGSKVHLAPDMATGEPKMLVVENVCSGLRSMVSLICFATLFALVCRVKNGLLRNRIDGVLNLGWHPWPAHTLRACLIVLLLPLYSWRFLMLFLAFPIAVVCNVLRITSMNLVAHNFSVAAAGPESWFHTASGITVFAIALLILFGVEQLIILGGRKWKQDWTDSRLLGYLDELPPSSTKHLRPWHPVALAALALIGTLTILWAHEAEGRHRGDIARQAVPAVMTISGKAFDSVESEMSRQEMAILQTEDYLKRRYMHGENEHVDLTIVFSKNNRKGTHPPEVCLEGAGGRIVRKQLHTVVFPALNDDEQPTTKQTQVRELISESSTPYRTERGEERWLPYYTLHLYHYKCGDAYTPNYFTQQLIIFLNGILNRNASGALIRIDVPIGRQMGEREVATARKLALAAAESFMQEIDRGLP